MGDPLQLQSASSVAIRALDTLTKALSRLSDLDDPAAQGMLDSLLTQLQEANVQLQMYREELHGRWPLSPTGATGAAELVREDAAHVLAPDGSSYLAQVYGEPRAEGDWIGWIAFLPLTGEAGRRTERETTQPSREALEYWAAGLEPVYFEGAFSRSETLNG